jgi:uncharacterized protein YggE
MLSVLSVLGENLEMTNKTTAPSEPNSVPTIEVTGSAIRQQAPKNGVILVPMTEKAPLQEAAWAKFQEAHLGLKEAIATAGTIGNVMPRQSSEEVSRGLRSGVEYSVTAIIEVEFIPANYGQILEALLKCGLPISTPRFVYDDLPKATPELLAEAAATARANAAGIAAGVQGKIGRLVSINIGPPRLKPVLRPTHAIESVIYKHATTANHFESRLLEEKLETFDTEIQVTVEYEIIEDSHLGEVA